MSKNKNQIMLVASLIFTFSLGLMGYVKSLQYDASVWQVMLDNQASLNQAAEELHPDAEPKTATLPSYQINELEHAKAQIEANVTALEDLKERVEALLEK